MKNNPTMPTMKDVAREAGVALGTVSNVFNGLPVGEAYRRRVEDAAEKLGYRVNQYARGLRTNQTRTVAVLLSSIADARHAAVTDELCRGLQAHNYRMLLYVTDGDPATEAHCLQSARLSHADGILAEIAPEGEIGFVRLDISEGISAREIAQRALTRLLEMHPDGV